MQEADLEDVIEEMELTDLGEEAEAVRALLRRNIDVFRGLGKAVGGGEFHMRVPRNFDISQLDPPHRRSEKERVLEEVEVTRLMALGVIEPSDALASTNFVFVAKKTKDAAGNPEQRTATDHRKINEFTEQDGYPMPPLEDNVKLSLLASFFLHTRLSSRILGGADGEVISEVYGGEDGVGSCPVCPDVNGSEERQRFLPTHDREHFAAIPLAGMSRLSG
jgi:hypothetical protein